MFRTLRAATAIRSHKEVWNHFKASLEEHYQVELPLSGIDYFPFMHALEKLMKVIPIAPWTKVDYKEPHMLTALLTYIELQIGLPLKKLALIYDEMCQAANDAGLDIDKSTVIQIWDCYERSLTLPV